MDAMILVGTVVLVGLLIRERRRNAALRSNEQLARECMRDAMKHRDELVIKLHDAEAAHVDAIGICVEQMHELDAYRAEEERRVERERAVSGAISSRLN